MSTNFLLKLLILRWNLKFIFLAVPAADFVGGLLKVDLATICVRLGRGSPIFGLVGLTVDVIFFGQQVASESRLRQFAEVVVEFAFGISGFFQHFLNFHFLVNRKKISMFGFQVLVDSRVSRKPLLAEAEILLLLRAV